MDPDATATNQPAPPTVTSTPDLTALQAHIDAATQTGGTQATAQLAKTLGFDTTDALTSYITDTRNAAEAAKTEDQKRADQLTAREAAATAREAAAAKLAADNTITAALLTAGVAPPAAARLVPLVTIDGDVTADTATAAVAALKGDATFAPLFTADTATTAAPSGVTGAAPTRNVNVGSGDDVVKQLLDERHPINAA